MIGWKVRWVGTLTGLTYSADFETGHTAMCNDYARHRWFGDDGFIRRSLKQAKAAIRLRPILYGLVNAECSRLFIACAAKNHVSDSCRSLL